MAALVRTGDNVITAGARNADSLTSLGRGVGNATDAGFDASTAFRQGVSKAPTPTPSVRPRSRATADMDVNLQNELKKIDFPDSTLKKAENALDGKGALSGADLKPGEDLLKKLPTEKKTLMEKIFGKGKWSPEAKARLQKAGLFSVVGLAFLMVMYDTLNPFEAIKKATGDVVDVVEDVGKGMRGIKDFFKGALDFFTSGWGLAIIGVVVGLFLLFLFMH